ncbi:MAG: rRNA pseudouridine synthase [Lachnospiraceae bacterium]|nr:rRNA pseudouridine synthase [Lachnospiraceae bacterium]
MAEVRLNKYLAENAGVSRREADRVIANGDVRVNGTIAGLGLKIDDSKDRIELNGRTVQKRAVTHYFAVNKPVGYISSTVKQSEKDKLVTELITSDVRLFPMGRLDKDSEGLIIMTNDGELMDRLLRARYGHDKEYLVELSERVSDSVISDISAGGLDIGEGRLTKPCRISRISDNKVDVILTEGMNRQIRKMFKTFGYEVTGLKRVRFMNVLLGDLKPGEYRRLTDKEIKGLKKATESYRKLTDK